MASKEERLNQFGDPGSADRELSSVTSENDIKNMSSKSKSIKLQVEARGATFDLNTDTYVKTLCNNPIIVDTLYILHIRCAAFPPASFLTIDPILQINLSIMRSIKSIN